MSFAVLIVSVVLAVLPEVAAAAPAVPAQTIPGIPAVAVPPAVPAGVPAISESGVPAPTTAAPPSSPTGSGAATAAPAPVAVPASALGLAPLKGSAVAVPPSVTGFVPGASVEDVSGRGAKTKLFKNPDGSTTLALSQRPVFFQDSHGVWQPVDTSVVADPSTPGWLVSKANTWTAHFAPLPVGVRIDSPEGQLAFSPVGAAPVVPTVTAVDTVTYVNAWPGADLRYQVLGDEVKETIVLNRRPTAATFAFTTAGLGFTSAAGGALAPKRAKSNWTLTSPVILDKQGAPLADAPVTLNPVGAAANAGLVVAGVAVVAGRPT